MYAAEVADLASATDEFEVAAFAENQDRTRCETRLLDRPVIWVDDLGPLAATHKAVCALGTTRRSGFIGQVERLGFEFATVRHPASVISNTSKLGNGCIVAPGVVVASHARIGRNVILNRGVLVGHHTAVDDTVTLNPGVNVAGAVTIGAGSYLGIGAIVLDRITIGAGALVGAGAVVTRDVPPNTQVVGVPARVVKSGIDGFSR
jgi:sugar O-acyltransferase (sialic acid O-acetyltransferase NeuD family)